MDVNRSIRRLRRQVWLLAFGFVVLAVTQAVFFQMHLNFVRLAHEYFEGPLISPHATLETDR